MACAQCVRHQQEAALYQGALGMVRRALRHEFDSCGSTGGTNAGAGCLACMVERLVARGSPEVLRAARIGPWQERAATLLRQLRGSTASVGEFRGMIDEVLAGLDQGEAEATEAARVAREQEADLARLREQRRKDAEERRRQLLQPAEPGDLPPEVAAAPPVPVKRPRKRKRKEAS